MDYLLQFFRYDHLPARLADVSRPYSELAHVLRHTLPEGPESTTALRKLLESKDCAVRGVLTTDTSTVDANRQGE